jgi:hypothetical protein
MPVGPVLEDTGTPDVGDARRHSSSTLVLVITTASVSTRTVSTPGDHQYLGRAARGSWPNRGHPGRCYPAAYALVKPFFQCEK